MNDFETFSIDPGTEVVTVRARGPLTETVMYGIVLPAGSEGIFEIDPLLGNMTVGPNGTSRLVIRNRMPTVISLDIFAYYASSGPAGNRVSWSSIC